LRKRRDNSVTRETVVISGVSLFALTLLHVAISLIGIVAGVVVLLGMLGSRRQPAWTALFLLATALTSVTGFLFPSGGTITPAQIFGYLSLVVLTVTLTALYVFHLEGSSRWIYVAGAITALYLNVFVAVVQAFAKIPALRSLAPTQSEPPFLVTQALIFVIFIALGIAALVNFHPSPLPDWRRGKWPRSSRA
jgi:hypothetical protein